MISRFNIRGIRGSVSRSLAGSVLTIDRAGKVNIMPRSQVLSKNDVAAGGVTSPPATTASLGVVQPDGATILVTGAGVISALAQRHLYAPCTVALLPAGVQGDRGMVTDATTTLALGLGLAPTGGGSNISPVYFDGTHWLIG